jgi:hypothetical protein
MIGTLVGIMGNGTKATENILVSLEECSITLLHTFGKLSRKNTVALST